MSMPSRPPVARQSSRVPGGFEFDEELSPIKTSFDEESFDHALPHAPVSGAALEKSGVATTNGLHQNRMEEESLWAGENDTFLQEKEMQQKLEDLDSTFLQTVSPLAPQHEPSASTEAGLNGTTNGLSVSGHGAQVAGLQLPDHTQLDDIAITQASSAPVVPQQTPAMGSGGDLSQLPVTAVHDPHISTSSLETLSSSPTAAAAARTISRAVSMASLDQGYETADDSKGGIAIENETTPNKSHTQNTPVSRSNSPTPTKSSKGIQQDHNDAQNSINSPDRGSVKSSRRPSFLKSRVTSQRSSRSSYTAASTDDGSELTLGADFALQSGGAVPQVGSLIGTRPTDYSRSVSLGSIASGISALGDNEDKLVRLETNLHTLNEEDTPRKAQQAAEPQTPASPGRGISTPTDTVIAQHVKDVQVPATLAREYRNRQRQPSPEKRNSGVTPMNNRNSKNLTLKEQSSTIDRLVKENFDLKLKITFLDEALNRRSDEGIKAMISENVDLRTAKFKSAKETRELKRSLRDLERKLKEKTDELVAKSSAAASERNEKENVDAEAFRDLEDEVLYLRERVTTYETDIERMRNENFTQETDRRKLAEAVKRFGESSRVNDVSAREEVDLWKDLLEAETARREQADEDNRRLMDEIRRLKSDASSTTTNNHNINVYRVHHRGRAASNVSRYEESERGLSSNGLPTAASSTLVEQLRHENSELRREIGAQTSMLQSRNREKQHLQDQIEDLKLGSRRGDGWRSTAGDSIFERSASRAFGRPASRASDQTRTTQISDPEREALEYKNGQLRDQNAKFRLEISELTKQMDELLDELESLDGLKLQHQKLQELYDNDIAEATEDLQNLSRERDDALRMQEDMEQEFQDLKAEGGEKISVLEEEVGQRNQELQALQNELSNHAEDAESLRREVRTLSERIVGIVEEVEGKSKKIRELQLEIDELGQEADSIDKDLREEKEKSSKLTVQQESSQSEIAFLREEQDADKIKIGDLENALDNLRNALTSEKERAKELDARLADERHQREVIGSKEKQEVQKIMNDLNRETSSAKEEARKLKKNLQSREIEATTFKERLTELESHLREVLGDPNGSRSTFLVSITKIQKELESTLSELETAHGNLAEKDRLLKNRDALLESHGLESRKLSELLERERQGRRADKVQFEQWQRTQQHNHRTVSQKDVRINELESSRQSDRKKIAALEGQFKDQLADRNTLLLTLWNRVSALCGSEWQHQNSLINNHLPTLDVIANSSLLPSFSRTLLSAVSAVEGSMIGFQSRIRSIERELWTEYQSLEHTLDARIKKLDRLESTVQSHRISGTFTAAPEIAKLRGENRLLKSEISTLQKQEIHARNASRTAKGEGSHEAKDGSAPPPSLARHYSSSAVEHLSKAAVGPLPPPRRGASAQHDPHRRESSHEPISAPIEPSQQRWIHRLRELERRLKAEREARLLDRSGARKRLEEGAEENRRLRGELERERVRKGAESKENTPNSAGTE